MTPGQNCAPDTGNRTSGWNSALPPPPPTALSLSSGKTGPCESDSVWVDLCSFQILLGDSGRAADWELTGWNTETSDLVGRVKKTSLLLLRACFIILMWVWGAGGQLSGPCTNLVRSPLLDRSLTSLLFSLSSGSFVALITVLCFNKESLKDLGSFRASSVCKPTQPHRHPPVLG